MFGDILDKIGQIAANLPPSDDLRTASSMPHKRSAKLPSATAAKPGILVLHGPNLNLLGSREPEHYGTQTLADINSALVALGQASGVTVECYQSNAEHELLTRIHTARQQNIGFIIINPAAFTHTSVALRDALAGVAIPFIEVHLSNVHARETFRHHSYFSDLAVGVISGLGANGYSFALAYALHALEE
jgi:3-dehydroquinate dehydratase-2